MSEYIVNVSYEEAELFIARFGIGGTQMFGHQLVGEIVRCRDCKCFIPSGYCGEMHHKALVNGFCSWGEHK